MSPVIRSAVDVLTEHLSQPVDIRHVKELDQVKTENYSLKIFLGTAGQAKNMTTVNEIIPDLEGDAYAVIPSSEDKSLFYLTGGNERAVLYAAYEGRDILTRTHVDHKQGVANIPLIPRRVAMLTASTRVGENFRPGLFDESLKKLARLGANGVFLVPSKVHGTSAGRDFLPFYFKGGKVEVSRPELEEWLHLFNKIKSQGHDIYISCPAWIPPDYSMEDVHKYYNGEIELKGFEEEVTVTFTTMLSAIFKAMPQVDGIVLHSLEMPQAYGMSVPFFPCRDLPTGERMMRTYIKALDDVCKRNGKIPCFWSHVAGQNTRMIYSMHNIMSEFPEVFIVEDCYWPNNGWPFLPVFGFLPDEIKDSIHMKNKLGLFLTNTDGEYFGGGKIPIAYPDPFYKASLEAVSRKAEMVLVRVNEHDGTHFGTMESMNAVHVEAGLRPLWDPAPGLQDVWNEWCIQRFGGQAAEGVMNALKKSQDVLLNGLTINGIPVMNHENILPPRWLHGSIVYNLFREPGTPVTNLDSKNIRGVLNWISWQTQAESISFQAFRDRQERVIKSLNEGLALIENEHNHLDPEDYLYLSASFDDALYIIKANLLLGEAAYAMNLAEENYDNHPDPVSYANRTIDQIESYAKEIIREKGDDFFRPPVFFRTKARIGEKTILSPSLPESMAAIAENYRSVILSKYQE